MQRRGKLAVAIGIAILAGLLPIASTLILSHRRAAEAERAHLTEYATWTLKRAAAVLSQAATALGALNGESWDACSPALVTRMRQVASDTVAIDELAFLQGGRIACTQWGAAEPGLPARLPDRLFAEGYGLALHAEAAARPGSDMLAMTLGSFQALIKPERLVDVLRDTTMNLGIALQTPGQGGGGQLIALSGEIAPPLVARLADGAQAGMTDSQLYAAVAAPGLVAFAVSEKTEIEGRLQRELAIMIPIGLLIAAILVSVVVWMSRQRLSLQGELALGIRKREFVAHYQPIISLSTGLCVGAEALVRWPQPDGRLMMPNSFIPVAEELGLIEQITDQVIDRVVHDIAGMLAADRAIHVSINISAEDIESGRFLPVLDAALARYGVAPTQVWLEATERGFINAEAARQTISRAQAVGHLVAIDDFGTGYSSLALLEKLPLDALKIDKSFVDSIGRDAATSVVTPHIIGMAQELKLSIVAEGIETLEQESYLQAAGVGLGQGWLYAPAMPAPEFMAFYRRHNDRVAAGGGKPGAEARAVVTAVA
ncbi:EAL domain-containing protein [Roseomonas sp. 18066]|uniref:EAL domain-containing protein n=1 Tax=Roseomonas sp. 18066 TaxID=2681412 RepID=UPI00135A73B6|nr:EAL domain-containing protein [Roseomonas sp. 18066]